MIDCMDNVERDHTATILWSMMDGDFLDEERCKLLLGWLDQFEKETKPYFEKFIKEADASTEDQAIVRSTGSVLSPKRKLELTHSMDFKTLPTAERDSLINSAGRGDSSRKNTESFLSPLLTPPPKPTPTLSANDRQREQIDMIVLNVARTLKSKVLDLLPRLCSELDYRETDQAFECSRMSHALGRMAREQ